MALISGFYLQPIQALCDETKASKGSEDHMRLTESKGIGRTDYANRNRYSSSRLIRVLALLAAAALGGTAAPVFAQQATFADNVLSIMEASVGETAYALELQLGFDGTNYDFSVLAAVETPVTGATDSSTFDGQVLHVPRVDVGGIDHYLNLALVNGDPITFRLASFGTSVESALTQATSLYNESVESQIVQLRCIACHFKGLTATGSALHFVRGESAAQTNLGVFSAFVNGKDLQRSDVLSKVRGIGHDGGLQLTQSSTDYAKLAEVLQLLVDAAAE